MKVLITNTLNQPLTLFYRLPASAKKDGNPGRSRLIEVSLPPRALHHEVVFSEDSHFEAFKEQNAVIIEHQKIFLGKTSEKAAEKASLDNAAKSKNEIKKRKDKVVHSFEEAASGANTKMSFEVKGGGE